MPKKSRIKIFIIFLFIFLASILSLKSPRKHIKSFFTQNIRKIKYILSYKDWTNKIIISKNKYKHKTWLVSFADNDTYQSAQLFLNFSAIRNGFKKIINYSNNDIIDFSKKNKHIFKYKRGNGLWTWKPYLILETLKKIPEGDILFYIDSASSINNDLSEIFNNLDDKNTDIILFNHDFCKKLRNLDWKCTNENFTKKSFLKFMNLDEEQYLKDYQVLGGFLIIKNNSKTRNFIKKWLDLSLTEELIKPLSIDDKDIDEQNKYFEVYKEDQAILSALAYKNKDFVKVLSGEEFISFEEENFKSKKGSITTHTKRKLEKSLLYMIE